MDVGGAGIIMNRLGARKDQCLLDRLDSLERVVLDANRPAASESGRFVHSSHGRYRVADEADLLVLESNLILARRHDPIPRGNVMPCDHRHHSWHGEGRRGVDRQHPCVGVVASQQLAVEQSRHVDVVCVDGATCHLPDCLDSGKRLTDHMQGTLIMSCRGKVHNADLAASSTASMMLT